MANNKAAAKAPATPAPAPAAPVPSSIDYAAVGRAYCDYRLLERTWNETKARDPFDGNITGRGELTQARDSALAVVRELVDVAMDRDK